MSARPPPAGSAPCGAVFLSYASQDAEAAKKICAALRRAGVEVWFDQSELVGGDAWDAKIRGQIASCALFVPLISANTQARLEGYFRLEWKLAAQRTHTMADEKTFLLPVVIDATRDAEAKVPVEFKTVQWTKLPGGEPPEKFCARVNQLLGGPALEAGRPRPGERDEGVASPDKRTRSRSWLAPVIAGAALLVAVAVFFALRPRRSPEEVAKLIANISTAVASAAAKSRPAPAPTAPQTEAQKLVAQARQIYEDGDELNRENLFLAEEFVQRALALDPAEPGAWELATRLSYQMVKHAIDDSPARRETLLRQASRTVALAPDAVSAQLVFANATIQTVQWTPDNGPSRFEEIERSLQRLAEREPQNWKVQQVLGEAYRKMNRTDDAIRSFQRAFDLSGEDPMVSADLVNVLGRRQRFPEAEAILMRALARQRSGRLLTWGAIVKCRWRGDAVGATKDMASWPAWLLQQERGMAVAWRAALWARQPTLALEIVRQFPRPYVRDSTFSGPRAVLSAQANELAGITAAAQADWRVVLQQCEQELAANASDLVALNWKAWALARLGDQVGAQAVATLLRQRRQSESSSFYGHYPAASLWATVGWTDLALSELRALLETPTDAVSLTRAYLELESAYDAIRADPRFQALMAAAPAPPPSVAAQPPPDFAAAKSVAVLAFKNLSGDPAREFFSDGLSEAVTDVLGRVPGLKVVASASAFSFKGKSVPIPEIARQLGVTHLVDGTVLQEGQTVRITAKLIKADGVLVWVSDKLDRELKNIFALHDEVAGLIAKNLSLKLGASSAASKAPVNPEAFERYVQARQAWGLRTSEGFALAESALNRALELEPNFARAHAALADVWTMRLIRAPIGGEAGDKNRPAELARIRAKITQALTFDPDSAEAHASLGSLLTEERKYAEAEPALRRSVVLNPNYASARQFLGLLLVRRGQMDEALEHLKLATELDPLSGIIWDFFCQGLQYAGRNREAIVASDRTVALRQIPGSGLWIKGSALVELGRFADAVALVESVPIDDGQIAATHLFVFARAGFKAEAEGVLARHRSSGKFSWLWAGALLALGQTEEAFALMTPSSLTVSGVGDCLWHSAFDPVRNDPRWVKLMADAGLTEAHARAQAWRKAHPPEKAAAK